MSDEATNIQICPYTRAYCNEMDCHGCRYFPKPKNTNILDTIMNWIVDRIVK